MDFFKFRQGGEAPIKKTKAPDYEISPEIRQARSPQEVLDILCEQRDNSGKILRFNAHSIWRSVYSRDAFLRVAPEILRLVEVMDPKIRPEIDVANINEVIFATRKEKEEEEERDRFYNELESANPNERPERRVLDALNIKEGATIHALKSGDDNSRRYAYEKLEWKLDEHSAKYLREELLPILRDLDLSWVSETDQTILAQAASMELFSTWIDSDHARPFIQIDKLLSILASLKTLNKQKSNAR